MEWRENRLVGIIAGALIFGSLITALVPFTRSRLESKKREKEAKEWLNNERERLKRAGANLEYY